MAKNSWHKIQLLNSILSIIRNLAFLVPLIPFPSAIIAVFLTFYSNYFWASAFFMIAILGAPTFVISRIRQQQRASCTNPAIVIEKDTLHIKVSKDHRTVNQTLEIHALEQIHEYHFKFAWTGCRSRDVEVSTPSDSGHINRDYPIQSVAFRWQPCSFKFATPLNRDDSSEFMLQFELPDRNNRAFPYHMVSYAHVKQCKDLHWCVTFADDFQPHKVFFYTFDDREIPIGKEELARLSSGAYCKKFTPQSGQKYSIEWEHQ